MTSARSKPSVVIVTLIAARVSVVRGLCASGGARALAPTAPSSRTGTTCPARGRGGVGWGTGREAAWSSAARSDLDDRVEFGVGEQFGAELCGECAVSAE